MEDDRRRTIPRSERCRRPATRRPCAAMARGDLAGAESELLQAVSCGQGLSTGLAQSRGGAPPAQRPRRRVHRDPAGADARRQEFPRVADERHDARARRPRRAGGAGLRRGARECATRRPARCAYAAGGPARPRRSRRIHAAAAASTSAAKVAASRGDCTASERRRLDSFIDDDAARAQTLPAGAVRLLLPGAAGDRVLRPQRISLARGVRSAHRGDSRRARDLALRENEAGSRRTSITTSTCRSTSGAS